MRDNCNRLIAYFFEQRFNGGEKEQIRIQVSDQVHRRLATQNEERQTRRAGEIILEKRPVRFCLAQWWIVSLQFAQGKEADLR